MWLPDISGFDLCRYIRKTEQTIPVIVYSADASLEKKMIGIEAGANDYIVRPEIETLLKTVRRLLNTVEKARISHDFFFHNILITLRYSTPSETESIESLINYLLEIFEMPAGGFFRLSHSHGSQ